MRPESTMGGQPTQRPPIAVALVWASLRCRPRPDLYGVRRRRHRCRRVERPMAPELSADSQHPSYGAGAPPGSMRDWLCPAAGVSVARAWPGSQRPYGTDQGAARCPGLLIRGEHMHRARCGVVGDPTVVLRHGHDGGLVPACLAVPEVEGEHRSVECPVHCPDAHAMTGGQSCHEVRAAHRRVARSGIRRTRHPVPPLGRSQCPSRPGQLVRPSHRRDGRGPTGANHPSLSWLPTDPR